MSIIITSVLPSGRSLTADPWSRIPLPQSLLWTGYCVGPRRNTHGVYRPWYPHNSSPSKGARDGGSFLVSFHVILPWEFIFSEVDILLLPQLTITIAFYDLHRCSGANLDWF